MKIVCLSDTHGHLTKINIPDGDVLVLAGDILKTRYTEELKCVNNFLGTLPHKHKIVIAGNHDSLIEQIGKSLTQAILTHAHYLEDNEVIIDGLKFWGSPWQPEFFNWSFNLPRGRALADKWAEIPHDTDVLITHGPPAGILDVTQGNKSVGCHDLLLAIQNLNLKAHIFGHIHESAGTTCIDGVQYVNASACGVGYRLDNSPIVINI